MNPSQNCLAWTTPHPVLQLAEGRIHQSVLFNLRRVHGDVSEPETKGERWGRLPTPSVDYIRNCTPETRPAILTPSRELHPAVTIYRLRSRGRWNSSVGLGSWGSAGTRWWHGKPMKLAGNGYHKITSLIWIDLHGTRLLSIRSSLSERIWEDVDQHRRFPRWIEPRPSELLQCASWGTWNSKRQFRTDWLQSGSTRISIEITN